MKVPRFERTTASPIIPGIARSKMAAAQLGAAMWRQQRMRMQSREEVMGEIAKLIQYRSLSSPTRDDRYTRSRWFPKSR
jgi:hypothetical protein